MRIGNNYALAHIRAAMPGAYLPDLVLIDFRRGSVAYVEFEKRALLIRFICLPLTTRFVEDIEITAAQRAQGVTHEIVGNGNIAHAVAKRRRQRRRLLLDGPIVTGNRIEAYPPYGRNGVPAYVELENILVEKKLGGWGG